MGLDLKGVLLVDHLVNIRRNQGNHNDIFIDQVHIYYRTYILRSVQVRSFKFILLIKEVQHFFDFSR